MQLNQYAHHILVAGFGLISRTLKGFWVAKSKNSIWSCKVEIILLKITQKIDCQLFIKLKLESQN